MTQREEVVVRQISFADVRRFASVTNSVFARDPGTAYVGYTAAVSKTESLRHLSMLRRFCDPMTYMICAKVRGQVAGVAMWSPPKHRHRRITLDLRIMRILLSIYETLVGCIYPDWLRKILNPSLQSELTARNVRRETIMKLDDEIRERKLPSDLRDGTYWTLTMLGVSEDYGRRGIGTKLLQWGFERADQENLPIFVSASQEGAALYIKSGFEILHHAAHVVYDPIRGWMDQTYLIRWNKSHREKF